MYDSYNTAIEKGINDSWLTAQLPDRMRENCAIEKADGTLQLGFRGNGFYLNPACELGYVKQRVQDILHFGTLTACFSMWMAPPWRGKITARAATKPRC